MPAKERDASEAASGTRPPRRNAAANSPRRREILRIAQQVIAEKGFSRTSTRDIAQRADLLSGSLFYHFPTKDALAEALFKPVFEQLVDVTREVACSDAPIDERIAHLVRRYVILCAGEHRLAMMMLLDDWQYFIKNFPQLAAGFDEINQLWLQLLKQGVAAGVVRDDVEPSILIHMVRSVSNDLVRWFDPDGFYSVEQTADAAVAFVLSGVRGENTPAAVETGRSTNATAGVDKSGHEAYEAAGRGSGVRGVFAGLRGRRSK
jgi:TetR/AcrR family transcriptional regulator, cholesterol catabolism regulator